MTLEKKHKGDPCILQQGDLKEGGSDSKSFFPIH